LHRIGVTDLVVVPIGFLSDHMEVVWDLDHEARERALDLQIEMVRASTVGTHPRFIEMIRELVVERVEPSSRRLALGARGPSPDFCASGCCVRPGKPTGSTRP
ncbi:MAG: ferrochelatase, partial [Myxococcales bacterium]|nr:ferrochelatase [Myxococcales bacterium]